VGFAAIATTANINILNPTADGSSVDPLWRQSSGNWLRDMAMTVLLGAICVAITWVRLRRLGPRRRR
jgi:hypothetical protein